jgi:hypothetical protein
MGKFGFNFSWEKALGIKSTNGKNHKEIEYIVYQ